ncbi:hypothetical protein GOP47_0023569 [Adiantum capillus-veneris]|uniref:GDP-D-glucose phosphorylase 1 n=1 Tax=Adiantum capillus-veneris TaxID=13818 RepID=A0A9D4U5X4_ADICA|nr:hypothetical protein GOP47_0023569 [Adiantum capillus-veneris]
MRTIQRVETVLSINQYDAENGKEPLGNCCAPGSSLPLFKFPRRLRFPPGDESCSKTEDLDWQKSSEFLDMVILAQWEDRATRGLFRYDVTACETKVLPGEYGFIAQLNEGRHSKKRPTEFRVDQVLQPFDPSKFNFTKAAKEELLFCVESGDSHEGEFYPEAPVVEGTNAVIINVSPIEYGHILLVPKITARIPQRIDEDSLLLAINMAVEAKNPFFRLGYNSLGAFATINHLHFQAYYLAVPFPVERAPSETLVSRKMNNGVKISELMKFPVRGIVFESADRLDELASSVGKCCCILQEKNIPFNILITDCGSMVYLFPQCYAERQACGKVDQALLGTQVNPAVWEISGHIVLKRKEDYERASEDLAWRLLAEVSLDEESFHELKIACLGELICGSPVGNEVVEGGDVSFLGMMLHEVAMWLEENCTGVDAKEETW